MHPIDLAFSTLTSKQKSDWHDHFAKVKPSWYGGGFRGTAEWATCPEVLDVLDYVTAVTGDSIYTDQELELLRIFSGRS